MHNIQISMNVPVVRISVNKTVGTLLVLTDVAARLDIDLTVMDEAVMVCN